MEIVKNGGNAAILDMSDDGETLAQKIGSAAKFFTCDVLDTESVSKAVQGTAEWAKQTGKPIGGVIPAAGVSTPATVCRKSNSELIYYTAGLTWTDLGS